VKKFNDSIKTEILKRKDLGLIDMKVNACLLAGMKLNDENCMQSLEALQKDGKLAYKFRIAKPKKAVIIGEFVKKINANNGFFYFKSIEDYIKSDIQKSFQFAILDDKIFEKRQFTIAYELPARVIKYSEIDKDKIENIEHLYQVWLKKIRGDERKAIVHLYFEQDENALPTNIFQTKYKNHQNIRVYSNKILENGITIGDERSVFFDRHGGLINIFSKEKSFVDANQSWVLIDKNNPDLDYISRYDIINNANLLAYELEEAGLLKVLVIDERVSEESIKVIDDPNQKKLMRNGLGFTKYDTNNSKLTLFDTAFASNVLIATHLNGESLKQEIDLEHNHYLNAKISDNLKLETNITSLYAKLSVNGFNLSWNCTDSGPKIIPLEIIPDVVIIHRTMLKKLYDTDENEQFLKNVQNIFPNLIVTTGSGATHGIKGDFKILPFNTLYQLVCGYRVQKLKLSKIIMQLNNNKI
jgi:hypothetical protein